MTGELESEVKPQTLADTMHWLGDSIKVSLQQSVTADFLLFNVGLHHKKTVRCVVWQFACNVGGFKWQNLEIVVVHLLVRANYRDALTCLQCKVYCLTKRGHMGCDSRRLLVIDRMTLKWWLSNRLTIQAVTRTWTPNVLKASVYQHSHNIKDNFSSLCRSDAYLPIFPRTLLVCDALKEKKRTLRQNSRSDLYKRDHVYRNTVSSTHGDLESPHCWSGLP